MISCEASELFSQSVKKKQVAVICPACQKKKTQKNSVKWSFYADGSPAELRVSAYWSLLEILDIDLFLCLIPSNQWRKFEVFNEKSPLLCKRLILETLM